MFCARATRHFPGFFKLSGVLPVAARQAESKIMPEGRRALSAYGYAQAKALVFAKYGEPKDALGLHTHSIGAPHSTQCNVRLLAAPFNPADVNQIQGIYPSKPNFSTILSTNTPVAVGGNEGAFEVISTGSGVKDIKKGDWVIMKKTAQGTWRTHGQFDESQLLRINDKTGLTPLQVGTVSVNPCTAYRMLKDYCDWDWLRQGEEWFIQNGANSGVGRAAIQLGRVWGLKSINVIRDRDTPEATEALKKELYDLGATSVVTESEVLASAPFRDYIKSITRDGREPIRLALNCVGGKAATALAKHLVPYSRFVTYGAMAKQPLILPAGMLIFSNISFEGFWVSQWSNKNPQLKLDTINDILGLIRDGRFKDVPSHEVKWTWDTPASTLAGEVQTTMEGKRGTKSVLVYEGD